MMVAFRAFIQTYTNLSDSDWEQISGVFEKKEFARNELILTEGNICRYFYFLEKGLVRFYMNNDGEEVTKFFTTSPYCFTSKTSFNQQTPATESIQAILPTVVWRTTFDQTTKLLNLNSWNTFTRKFVHEVQNYTEELMMQIKTETAEQRYFKLLKQHPDITPKIPLKFLASFLGIAPQSLSRIRKNSQT